MSQGKRLEGKVALITGAGDGIGASTAALFQREGATVLAADKRAEALKQWDNVEHVVPVLADVTSPEDVKLMVAEAEHRYGRLDILCNIAGITDMQYPLLEADDERWERILDTDLKGTFRVCRQAVPLMLKSGGGAIVNIGSYAASRGNHGICYTTAKAGVVGLTKSIAFEYGDQGIRCNVINPGCIKTNIFVNSGGEAHPLGTQRLMKIITALPDGWEGMPEDVAHACLFLCSDESRYINGAALAVDGGMSAF